MWHARGQVMEEYQKKGDLITFDNIIHVINFAAAICGCVTGNAQLCIGILIILLLLILGVCCLYYLNKKQIEETKNDTENRILKRRYQAQDELCNGIISESEYRKNEKEFISDDIRNKKKYNKRMCEIRRKYGNSLVKFLVAFVVILMFSYSTVQPFFAEQLKKIVEGSQEEKKIEESESKSETEEQIDIDENIEKGKIIADKTFHLDEPEIMMVLESNEINAVFHKGCIDIDKAQCIQTHFQNLISMNRRDNFKKNLSTMEDKAIERASKNECLFEASIIMVKEYAKQDDYTKWDETLMHSAKLDEIIEDRKDVWNSGKRNAELAWLIANDHQTYALEYQHQTMNESAILYHYMQSIIWAEYAIEYEDAEKEILFDYIKSRYNDIATCMLISKEYRDDAQIICEAMGVYQDYIEKNTN